MRRHRFQLRHAPPRGGAGAADAAPAGAAGAPASIRQAVACALVFLLSARIPEHLAALGALLTRSQAAASESLAAAGLMVLLDGFGVLCALYLSHARLRGVRLWRCYPPQRLIPLSLHFLGLLWGLLTLTLSGAAVAP